MTKTIRGIVLYSNTYIGAVAAAMTYRSFMLQGLVPDIRIVFFAAVCTLGAYSLHSLDGDEADREDRNAWNRRHRKWLWGCLTTSVLVALFMLISIDGILPLLLPAMLLTAYYLFSRLSMFGLHVFRLRGKTIVLALTWTYTTYLLPLLQAGSRIMEPRLASGLLIEFCMIYLICLFFDHRDAKKEEYHTWIVNPVMHIRQMLWIVGIFFAVVCTWGYMEGLSPVWLMGKILIMALLLATSNISLRCDSDVWFNLFLDGCLAADIVFLLV